jgi:GDP-L-fucose synthase
VKKILITGGSGLVGSSFRSLTEDAIFPSRSELNLLDRNNVFKFIEKNDFTAIIHVAARVGGVAANTKYVADFYSDNILMNTNIIDAAVKNNVPNLVCCLSTCIYPDERNVVWPLTEEQLHNGEPHESNFGYAYAKRMVDIQLRAVRQQYNLNYISVTPNNLYGKNDNFDLNDGHVLPALIRKIWEAKINNKPYFEVWGDGEVYREFTYSEDIAKAILFCLKKYNSDKPINIGNTQEYLLKDVIGLLKNYLQYDGEIVFDVNKPKGQARKPTCNNRFLELGWKKEWFTPLEKGLKNTCEWFVENYPNVRGVS